MRCSIPSVLSVLLSMPALVKGFIAAILESWWSREKMRVWHEMQDSTAGSGRSGSPRWSC